VFETLDRITNGLDLSDAAKKAISKTSFWAKIISIISFCTLVINFVFLLFLSSFNPLFAIFLMILHFLPFLVIYHLFQSSKNLINSIKLSDQEKLELGLKHLGYFFQINGILLILVVLFFSLLFLISTILVINLF